MRPIPIPWRWSVVVAVSMVATLAVVGCQRPLRGADNAPVGDFASVSDAQRAAAALTDCPPGRAAAPAAGPLAGLTLDCLATGRPVALAAALAGRPALLTLWAYWCAPCARELPALQQYATQAAGAVTVLTVHSDPAAAKGLARLADLQVHLPGVQDPDARVRRAVQAPEALPLSLVLRPDGALAKLVVRPFDSADDISATVADALGVPR